MFPRGRAEHHYRQKFYILGIFDHADYVPQLTLIHIVTGSWVDMTKWPLLFAEACPVGTLSACRFSPIQANGSSSSTSNSLWCAKNFMQKLKLEGGRIMPLSWQTCWASPKVRPAPKLLIILSLRPPSHWKSATDREIEGGGERESQRESKLHL